MENSNKQNDVKKDGQKEKIVSELKESGKYETIVCIDENNDIETIHVK